MYKTLQDSSLGTAEQWPAPNILQASPGFSEGFLAAFPRRLLELPDVVAPARHGLHLYIRDAPHDPLLSGLHDLIDAEGYHSYLTIPGFGSRVMGWLGLYYDREYEPDDDELALSQALADQLALAVQRVRERLADDGVQLDNAAAGGAHRPKRIAGPADAEVRTAREPTPQSS